MQIYFHTFVQNNLMKALSLVEKAYPLFQQLYAKVTSFPQNKTLTIQGLRLSFKDQDLGAFLISDYAYLLASLGISLDFNSL